MRRLEKELGISPHDDGPAVSSGSSSSGGTKRRTIEGDQEPPKEGKVQKTKEERGEKRESTTEIAKTEGLSEVQY